MILDLRDKYKMSAQIFSFYGQCSGPHLGVRYVLPADYIDAWTDMESQMDGLVNLLIFASGHKCRPCTVLEHANQIADSQLSLCKA